MQAFIISAVAVPEILMNDSQSIYLISDSCFFQYFPDNRILGFFIHMNAAADRIKVVLLIVSDN